jgi:hypothetical protein
MLNMHKLIFAIITSLITSTAFAGNLYSDGSTDGNNTGLQINFSNYAANSFTIASTADITSITFETWDAVQNGLTNIDWAITSQAGTGSTFASGANTTVTSQYLGTNAYGYALDLNTIQISGLVLNGGSYWLELSNAVTSSNISTDPYDVSYWDVNTTGSSLSWANGTAYDAGNPFSASQTQGTASFSVNGSPVPEPATVVFFAIGLLGLGLYRQMQAQA